MEKIKLHTRMYGWKYVWKEFAEEFAGTVTDAHPESSQTPISVQVPIKNTGWFLIYKVHPGLKAGTGHTTVEAFYSSGSGFRFAVHPPKHGVRLDKVSGVRDVSTGDKRFDPNFLIKSNETNIARSIFLNQTVRDYIMAEPAIQIWVQNDETDSSHSPRLLAGEQYTLCLKLPDIVDDFERLKLCYQLMELLLTYLSQVETAVAAASSVSGFADLPGIVTT